jgi:molecular chaperone DnaK
MKNFVGIDLGTTNSVICSYDASETRIWKSPEQNDVTPSAIYIDRRCCLVTYPKRSEMTQIRVL